MARSLKLYWPAKFERTYEFKAEQFPNSDREKILLWFSSWDLRKGSTLRVWKTEEVSRLPKPWCGSRVALLHNPAGWTWRTRLLRARNEIPPWTKQRERSSCQRGQRQNLHGQAMLSVSLHPAAWASLLKLGTWHSGCDVFYYKANTERLIQKCRGQDIVVLLSSLPEMRSVPENLKNSPDK